MIKDFMTYNFVFPPNRTLEELKLFKRFTSCSGEMAPNRTLEELKRFQHYNP